jgi:hypothetical protein
MSEMLNDDLTLLREYARCNSEEAFAALVARNKCFQNSPRQPSKYHPVGKWT